MTEERRPSRWEDLPFDKNGRLIDLNGPVEFAIFGPPPPITWTPVMDLADVFGLRAATMNSRGPIYNLRIASEVFQDSGGWYVHLVGEDQWWAWIAIPDHRRPGRPGKAVCWPTRYVWVERRERCADSDDHAGAEVEITWVSGWDGGSSVFRGVCCSMPVSLYFGSV